MRVVAMLVMHQLAARGVDPALFEVFWMVAGSMGAVMLFALAWRVLRLALYVVVWGVVVALALVAFGHLAMELF
jgi:hypothetical protein